MEVKLTQGIFDKEQNIEAKAFISSLSFDNRLYPYDIRGSIAHCAMLGECGIISPADSQKIITSLNGILEDITLGKLVIKDADDIHMFVEGVLTARLGEAGKRVHTARSRNDQIALDIRMYCKEAITTLRPSLAALIKTLAAIALEHVNTVMAAYTHMQKAQPVTLGHYLSAYVQMFLRDIERLNDCYKRTDVMPLGSCALASTSYPIDRERVAELLGFSSVTQNSIDAVSDRDFQIELVSACTQIMLHLSRMSEELIYWSTSEFGYAEISEGYSSTSSIMPQKKNPDVAELIRGKTGRVAGSLTALIMLMKGLPLAYNSDMQEDKHALFDCVDTTESCLKLMNGMLSEVKFNVPALTKGAKQGFTQATDAADYLVKKGLPFRTAHEIIGKMVRYMIKNKKTFETLSLNEYRDFSPLFDADVQEALSLKQIIASRVSVGAPAPSAVKRELKAALKRLDKLSL
ncbi:MAG: argininosuccinate lyase [Clostridiales bacterium]|jgi:argininosuccinate lyase|nr:argininosuccinate lyase [Clostridiales bacterium]